MPKRLGADHVVVSSDVAQMAAVAGRFHLIVDTVPYVHDLNPYIPTLSFKGALVLVGYLGPIKPSHNSMPMVIGGKAVGASMISGIAATQEMLDFCGEHGNVFFESKRWVFTLLSIGLGSHWLRNFVLFSGAHPASDPDGGGLCDLVRHWPPGLMSSISFVLRERRRLSSTLKQKIPLSM